MFEPKRETEVQHPVKAESSHHRFSPAWVCRVHGKSESAAPVPIPPDGLILGAEPSCHLIINDAAVSGRHARLSLHTGGVLIEDMQSTNGTFLRTTRIDKVQISAQTKITLGTTVVDIMPASQIDVPPLEESRFGGLVGGSVAMRKCFAIMKLASRSDATVVIEGESGTGKEFAARAIHEQSERAHMPFVVVDCAGIPEQLMESHLFGHCAGAFTNAVRDRKGAFALADGGTIFLDELGELPLSAQAKLLRVLEAQTVQPLGAERPIQVNVRVVAATNRNLEQMVADNTFRFDLFHRLAVVHFQMPSLRDHVEDIPALVAHFYGNRKINPGAITGSGLNALTTYDWPGNVRELRNVLERAWVLSGVASPAFSQLQFAFTHRMDSVLPLTVDTGIPFKDAKEKWLAVFEKQYVEELITRCDGNISKAAKYADVNRNHFRKLMDKYGLIK
ncbi:MAG: sigma 54-dependent Fis family transcriptional regulator [Deltaproteobacteria bacterium]|nr:sigma 54-dependent Fis family transcriptional regulator [Deltaproteobacteria bacterium]MBN2674495.1 sigma 54-dependent Fis family transcriptional regulator [Deltaproteobacteria bacterium]